MLSGEYAIAFSTRLATAVTSWLSLPYTVSPRSPEDAHLDVLGRGGGAAAVDDLGDDPVDRARLRAAGSGSAPCSRDSSSSSLTSRPSRADSCRMRSANRPTASRSAGSSPRERVLQRLAQQLQRTDRGLQLVADVGDEVPPHPGDPVRLGDVGRLDGDVPAADVDRAHVHAQRLGVAVGPRDVQLDDAAQPAAPGLAGQRADDRVGVGRRPDETHLPRGRVGQHGMVLAVQHQHAHLERVQAGLREVGRHGLPTVLPVAAAGRRPRAPANSVATRPQFTPRW